MFKIIRLNKHQNGWLLDTSIAILFLIFSFYVSVSELTHYRNSGGKQFDFYQMLFEPAVALACGKGFGVHTPPISISEPLQNYAAKSPFQDTPLSQFLFLKRDTLNCAELPNTLMLKDPPQQSWYYLVSSVGLLWKLTGISWAAVDKLTAAFFALSIALSYGIFRLGMGHMVAIPLTLLLCGSTLQLSYLPWLRDYVRGPFLLAILLILGLLIKKPVKSSGLIALAAICGLIAGIGDGFRNELIATIPLITLTILFFLPGNVGKNIFTKVMAVTIVFGVFAMAAYPVLLNSSKSGNGMFDSAIAGLMTPFTMALKLNASPVYEIGHQYNDILIYSMVGAHADHFLGLDLDETRNDSIHSINSLVTPAYRESSSSLYRHLIEFFPADFLIRGYASATQVLNLGFISWDHYTLPPWQTVILKPTDNAMTKIYQYSRPLLGVFQNHGIFLSILSVFLIGILNLRIAVFLFLGLIYFSFYPALQFIPRHYFHLEFISLWIFGFLIYHAFQIKKIKDKHNITKKAFLQRSTRSAVVVGSFCILGVFLLQFSRHIQSDHVKNIINTYESAEKRILSKNTIQTKKGKSLVKLKVWNEGAALKYFPTGKMLLIELGGKNCTLNHVDFTIEYDLNQYLRSFHNISKQDFSSVLSNGEKTFIYAPIFRSQYLTFKGIKMPSHQMECLGNIYEVTGLQDYPLWLYLKVTPNWREESLFQTLQVK